MYRTLRKVATHTPTSTKTQPIPKARPPHPLLCISTERRSKHFKGGLPRSRGKESDKRLTEGPRTHKGVDAAHQQSPRDRGEGGRGISGRGDKGDETQCSFRKVRGEKRGVMKVEPSSGEWGRSEDQQGRKRSQKERNQPSREALGGRGWGAEVNAEKWTRHKWTMRRSNGMEAGSISHAEQSEIASCRNGEKPCTREKGTEGEERA